MREEVWWRSSLTWNISTAERGVAARSWRRVKPADLFNVNKFIRANCDRSVLVHCVCVYSDIFSDYTQMDYVQEHVRVIRENPGTYCDWFKWFNAIRIWPRITSCFYYVSPMFEPNWLLSHDCYKEKLVLYNCFLLEIVYYRIVTVRFLVTNLLWGTIIVQISKMGSGAYRDYEYPAVVNYETRYVLLVA